MNARTFARMLIALPATPALTRVANRTHLRRIRIGHCPGCGTTVRADDVLGLIGFHVAHAECSLVYARRLRSGRR
jgi:hypothetical protein